ncbi:NlpC/P60 family protein [Aciduricibacillus chroicocephali]|uniref:NlpC/P60 family protein n=1 Tax=Aciduricibacillus chroicocephali TaxID=3054939 RepID=A0ABY9KYV8_9BACI|nr:NlpC/P60 family protein [Bacillaceae bacterium 44XB]
MKKTYTIRKGAVMALVATSMMFSPVLTGSAFAHGAAPSAPVQSAAGIVIPQGAQGQEVADLQKKLKDHGYNLKVDGIYGPITQEKVIAFQYAQGWNADGIVDKPTLNALNRTNAKSSDVVQTSKPVQTSAAKTTNTAAASDNTNDTVAIAKSLVGTPYVFGGTTPAGFDSSGFINYVFSQQGISLERTHAGMWENNGVHVSKPSVGDVVFFENTYKSGVSHSGIYIGNNQMIHAGTEDTGVEVTTPEQWKYYWSKHYIGAKRF